MVVMVVMVFYGDIGDDDIRDCVDNGDSVALG